MLDSSLPTVDIASNYSGLNGIFQLIYVEANGLPAVLDMEVDLAAITTSATPIPGALPLFVSGLAGLGMLMRRRKRKEQAAL